MNILILLRNKLELFFTISLVNMDFFTFCFCFTTELQDIDANTVDT